MSFESDLRDAREARGLSLGEIQQQTRIPVDVLRRFEEGDLIGDPTYNEVYLQAFLKSYAKAVGLAPSDVRAAYEAHKSGSYSGGVGTGSAKAPSKVAAPDDVPEATPKAAAPPPATPPEATPDPPRPTGAAPAVTALKNTPDPTARPVAAGPPKTLAQARVNRPAVPDAKRSFDKNWGLIIGLLALFLVVVGGTMWWLFADGAPDRDEPDDEVVEASADAEAEADSVGAPAPEPVGPRLELPLTAVVTAGGDGLQWFRVSADDGERLPNWIDAGTSQTFTADSALVLWGEGNEGGPAYAFEETTVEIQGLRFTPQSGKTLTLTRQTGQALLDSLASAGR